MFVNSQKYDRDQSLVILCYYVKTCDVLSTAPVEGVVNRVAGIV